eukprot:CAMPEP_0184650578 /NCGR_PEP_ID=MMETSP0308-20130426/8128_1 /TAXON_ID=38269 /ORGANISM="Gloeochaete witrockiana, Strain SAG 46.84" /LENGTH=428 /DNA_ID=CAMNT_0027084213 /DNA_START=655 /DNA_END=1942 /DNA_ORIENTATION=+
MHTQQLASSLHTISSLFVPVPPVSTPNIPSPHVISLPSLCATSVSSSAPIPPSLQNQRMDVSFLPPPSLANHAVDDTSLPSPSIVGHRIDESSPSPSSIKNPIADTFRETHRIDERCLPSSSLISTSLTSSSLERQHNDNRSALPLPSLASLQGAAADALPPSKTSLNHHTMDHMSLLSLSSPAAQSFSTDHDDNDSDSFLSSSSSSSSSSSQDHQEDDSLPSFSSSNQQIDGCSPLPLSFPKTNLHIDDTSVHSSSSLTTSHSNNNKIPPLPSLLPPATSLSMHPTADSLSMHPTSDNTPSASNQDTDTSTTPPLLVPPSQAPSDPLSNTCSNAPPTVPAKVSPCPSVSPFSTHSATATCHPDIVPSSNASQPDGASLIKEAPLAPTASSFMKATENIVTPRSKSKRGKQIERHLVLTPYPSSQMTH